MQEDRLLTLEDVARITGINEKTIRKWIKSGDLPHIRLGRQYRIARADLDAFIAKHRKQATQEDTKQQSEE